MSRDEAFALYIALEDAGYRPHLSRGPGNENKLYLYPGPGIMDRWEMPALDNLIEFAKVQGYAIAVTGNVLEFMEAER